MNTKKIIWLAGIFEGEGTTGLYKYLNGKFWRITTYWMITNTDPNIINEIDKIVREELKINLHLSSRPQNPEDNNNLSYQVTAKKMKDCYILLETLYPYLVGVKKVISELVMRFIQSRNYGNPPKGKGTGYSELDEKLFQECKKYTRRGITREKLKSSEAIRQTLSKLEGEDMVRTSIKIGEWID